jgi:hypothetical protein
MALTLSTGARFPVADSRQNPDALPLLSQLRQSQNVRKSSALCDIYFGG